MDIRDFAQHHKWRSEDQKQGFLALVKDLRDHTPGRQIEAQEIVFECVAWMIQKDHESNQWWQERVSDLAKGHDDKIVKLSLEVREVRGELARLRSAVKRGSS